MLPDSLSCPNRRVVTHGKQRGVLASTKKIGHLLRKKHESRRDFWTKVCSSKEKKKSK